MSLTHKNGRGSILLLEEKLWAAADKMRGHMDASEYKYVVLGLVFLKYISDVFFDYWLTLQNEGSDPEDRANYEKAIIFWVPENARWTHLVNNSMNPDLATMVDDAMIVLERENPALQDVLPIGYAQKSFDRTRLAGLVDLIDTVGLGDAASRSKDVLGYVYEYFLGRFASIERRGGEFYTPQSVVKLLVEMIEPFKGTVYDPCCGSGGMFVQSEKFVIAHGGRKEDIRLYGQELNPTTWKLCKMNLAIRNITGDIGNRAADTFHDDLHGDVKADYVLANPPFNISDWGGEQLRQDPRWIYGTPPSNNANMAWIQHIIYHLSPSGTAGFVLTNGSLANSGQGEGAIRKLLIKRDLIDCIVALPIQLFYNTQIAACLWFISHDKKDPAFRNRSGQTLFIYANSLGQNVDRTHRELTDEDISTISETYHAWRNVSAEQEYTDIPGFCKSATIDEIASHNWALVPGRYVGFDKNTRADTDVVQLQEELIHVERRLKDVTKASDAALNIFKEILNG